jgi:hypothetical protein
MGIHISWRASWSYDSDSVGLPSPDTGNASLLLLKTIYKIYKQTPGICHLINKPGYWVAGKSCFEF